MRGLKYSLLRISQICGKGNKIMFLSNKCIVTYLSTKRVILIARRRKNMYVAELQTTHWDNLTCLSTQAKNDDIRHMNLGHVISSLLNKLVFRDLVPGLPKFKFSDSKVSDAYVKAKKTRSLFTFKKHVINSRVL